MLFMFFFTLQITLGVLFAITTLVSADVSELRKTNGATKLDPVLRKALLRALSNLENESETTEEEDSSSTTVETTTDESTRRSEVRISSFLIDASNATAEDSGEEIIKTIIIKKPRTTLTPPFKDSHLGAFAHPDPLNETNDIEIDSVQAARSVSASVSANAVSSESSEERPSSTTTSTTTTPAPTTNADGENIENVKEEDVKIFQAPLVAAFTVQQDERGTPKHVIPILRQADNELKPAKPIMSFKNEPISTTTEFPLSDLSSSSSSFFTTPRNEVKDSLLVLEQRNRLLEEQIAYLRAQQHQQEELYRQQQFFFNRQQSQPQRFEQRAQVVQLIPSVQLSSRNVPISLEQHLPIKEPSDFARTDVSFTNNNNNQGFNSNNRFNGGFQNGFQSFQSSPSVTIQKSKEQDIIQQNALNLQVLQPPALSTQLQLPTKPFQNFANLPNPNLIDNRDPGNKNRVFRNDVGQTGNFGFNSNNNVQIQQSIPLNFRPSQPFNVNSLLAGEQNLHNLLLRSGVSFSPRSAEEDFNIISKVLALNHGIQPSQTNNLGLGFDQQRQRFR